MLLIDHWCVFKEGRFDSLRVIFYRLLGFFVWLGFLDKIHYLYWFTSVDMTLHIVSNNKKPKWNRNSELIQGRFMMILLINIWLGRVRKTFLQVFDSFSDPSYLFFSPDRFIICFSRAIFTSIFLSYFVFNSFFQFKSLPFL